MSNDYFQFKKFRVGQELCSMKVTTDACIQGAWMPVLPHVRQVLDIGTGTGLLALMLAQRSGDIHIDAIEMDVNAARQAGENVAASPWSNRVHIMAGDARSYNFRVKYDLIISNPPFFNNSLLSNDAGKDMARHTLHLSYDQLLAVLNENLADDGYVSVMLPLAEYSVWKPLAEDAGFFESCVLSISHHNGAPVKRVVAVLSKNDPSFVYCETLAIMGEGQKYSKGFIDLLSPFYLDL